MSPQEVYIEARKHGILLELSGDKLVVRFKESITEELTTMLRHNKPGLLDLLKSQTAPWGSTPRTPDEFIGSTRHIARAVFNKMAQIKANPGCEPLDRSWLFNGLPGLGKTALAKAVGNLAGHPSNVEQINGQSCSIGVVRGWQQDGLYVSLFGIRVQIVDEIDAASPAAWNELRTYLDKLPGGIVFIATTNKAVSDLPEPLRSRFKVYTFEPPEPELIAQLLMSQYRIPFEIALRIAAEAKGNIRQAKANALAWLEAIAGEAMPDSLASAAKT